MKEKQNWDAGVFKSNDSIFVCATGSVSIDALAILDTLKPTHFLFFLLPFLSFAFLFVTFLFFDFPLGEGRGLSDCPRLQISNRTPLVEDLLPDPPLSSIDPSR